MNNVVYTIPVVFHVIHLGESVGTGSNISDSQLMQALADLKYDFRDIGGAGMDVEIDFCLAQRAPDGSPSTGINRVNGYGVGDYESIGMAVGSNEIALKALSVWPNRDYLNIWIVYNIVGGFGVPPPNGFATLPGTLSNVDGIVLRADATGTSSYSHVITHEAGHFFGLYHTYEGGDTTNCPPSGGNCNLQGDRVCDTPPHMDPGGGCDTTGIACDSVTSLSQVAHNYMNHVDDSCRNRFTSDQIVRMRTVLMTLRETLTYSIGCEPGCTSVTSDFIAETEIPYLVPQTFVNTSSGGTLSYKWRLNGIVYDSIHTDLDIIFYSPGFYDVCLDATDTSGCVNRKCDSILVHYTCPASSDPCEKVINGDFEYISALHTVEDIDMDVCAWVRTNSSPFYCAGAANNAMGLLYQWKYSAMTPDYDFERITSRIPLDLDSNTICKISFDYLVAGSNLDAITISLLPEWYKDFPINIVDSISTAIAQVLIPPTDYLSQKNNECYDSTYSFHHHEEYFYYKGNEGTYLNITGKRSNQDTSTAYFFIDNISINCCPPTACIPEPSFTDTLVGCTATFTGSNTGDPGDFLWNFGDDGMDTGAVVTHTFLWGDTFTVCLTIRCPDLETTQTICHEIIIPDICDACEVLEGIRASRCDTAEAWISSFCFEVPKGFKPCQDNNLLVSSPQSAINVLSYEISPFDSLNDQVCVSVKLAPLPGYDFEANGATGHITLCSDGEIPMICRSFEIGPFVCDICETPVSDTAICNDLNLNDNVRIFRGSIAVTLSTSTGEFYKAVSTDADFEVDVPNIQQSDENFTIPYSFITTNHNLTNFQVILNFIDQANGNKICVPVNITLPVCDTLPTNCGLEWSVKNMACSGSDGGNLVIFNFAMSVNVGNRELCNGGLFGTVDGGLVDILAPNPTVSGVVLTFNVNMVIPCDNFVSGQVYNMRLYLCSEEGELECLLFPFRLFCEDCEEIEFRAQPSVSLKSEALSRYWIVPNPATDRVNIFVTGFDPEKRQEARLFNQLGRLVATASLTSEKTEIDVSQYYPGIYYIVVSANGALVKTEKVIIMH